VTHSTTLGLSLVAASLFPALPVRGAAVPASWATAAGVGRPADGCAGTKVATEPERPHQGSFFRVRVSGVASGTTLGGRVAAQPLHLVAEGGANEAIAAAPIDGESPLRIVVRCVAEGAPDSIEVSVPLASADYPLERLTVAPRFGTAPDSALAARMAREAKLAAEVARRAHETPRLWQAPFARPRASRVTSTFGSGREFNGTVTSRHMGTDYAGAVGAPVRAANRGIVRLVGNFFLGGNVIYLDHGAGIVTAYLHLSKVLVAEGDTVDRGALIGRVGATGRVTGPHLHWITRYGGVTADPASLLKVTGAGAAGARSGPGQGAGAR
jgi:murein DD-endopeptidase MepM/ murein hydrolase activator NlpD